MCIRDRLQASFNTKICEVVSGAVKLPVYDKTSRQYL